MNFQYNIYKKTHNELILFIKLFKNHITLFNER